MIKIEKQELDEDLQELMEFEYVKYEEKHNIFCNCTPYCFVAKNENNILGIVSGFTCYDEIYIDDLVVVEKYRNNNIGTMLINKVEDYFKDKNFNNINLCTNGFQAPKFYEKCGFQLEFVRKNIKNPKLDKYFYVKFLNN